MLTIKEGRKYLKNINLTDEEVQKVINNLYSISENVMRKYIEEMYGKSV